MEDVGVMKHNWGRARFSFTLHKCVQSINLNHAYEATSRVAQTVSGDASNIGGGPENTLSLLELINLPEHALKISTPVKFDDRQPGDQPCSHPNWKKLGGLSADSRLSKWPRALFSSSVGYTTTKSYLLGSGNQ